jgi:hypothetical protein
MKKTLKVIKERAFRKTDVAREFYQLRRKHKIIKLFKNRIRMKRCPKLEQEIYELFRMKRVLNAWREHCQNKAKIHTIGEFRGEYNFCVKYSEFCKCLKC